jgi:hypothetical protein
MLVMAVVLATSCGGKGGGEKIVPLATGTTAAVTATTGAPAPTPAAAPTERSVAERFEGLLEQNNGARAQVTSSVQGVSTCTLDPNQAHDALGGVINTRRSLVDQVNNLDVRSLSEGADLKANLVQAWQASIAADVHFQAWMLGVAQSGCTRNGVNSGPEWDAAGVSSAQATRFKQNVSTVWAGVASRFGLRQWAEGEL